VVLEFNGVGTGMGEGGQEVQASSYGMSKSRGSRVQHKGHSHGTVVMSYGDRWLAAPVVSTAKRTEKLNHDVVHVKLT